MSTYDGARLAVTVLESGPDRVRIGFTGELDLSTARACHQALVEAFGRRRSGVLEIDLRDLAVLDSAGLQILVRWHTRAAVQGCDLVVSNPRDVVRRVLEVTGLLDRLGAAGPATPV